MLHRKKQKLILALDGGGTKTHVALAKEDGEVLARVKVGQMNAHSASEEMMQEELDHAWVKIAHKAKIDLSARLVVISIGVAGLDSKEDFEKVHKVFTSYFKKNKPKKFIIVNDTVIGLFAGTSNKNAIAVIGGTGSNCYGRNAKGKEAMAGGLDYLLSDEGSGYEIGLKTLKAVAKSADGRGPKTILEPMVYKHFEVKNVRGLISKVYHPPLTKYEIGKLALLVEEAAIAGDKVARQIAKEAADELVLLVQTVAEKLSFTPKSVFDVVMIGGVLQHDPVVTKRFRQQLKKHYPKALAIIPEEDPVMGAVRLGRAVLGGKVNIPSMPK